MAARSDRRHSELRPGDAALGDPSRPGASRCLGEAVRGRRDRGLPGTRRTAPCALHGGGLVGQPNGNRPVSNEFLHGPSPGFGLHHLNRVLQARWMPRRVGTTWAGGGKRPGLERLFRAAAARHRAYRCRRGPSDAALGHRTVRGDPSCRRRMLLIARWEHASPSRIIGCVCNTAPARGRAGCLASSTELILLDINRRIGSPSITMLQKIPFILLSQFA